MIQLVTDHLDLLPPLPELLAEQERSAPPSVEVADPRVAALRDVRSACVIVGAQLARRRKTVGVTPPPTGRQT